MSYTTKHLVYSGGTWMEDETYKFTRAVYWTADTGDNFRAFAVENTYYLERPLYTVLFQKEVKTLGGNWVFNNRYKMDVVSTTYVSATTGVVVLDPYEDDLDQPIMNYSGGTVGYRQKLKSGLMTEDQFFRNTIALGLSGATALFNYFERAIVNKEGLTE